MTLKPIPGAPSGASIPDFPTGDPGPLVVPAASHVRRSAGSLPTSVPPPEPSPALSPRRRPGPVEIRGSGGAALLFRAIPEVPAINRSSMIISITGQPAGERSSQPIPRFDLPADQAKAFLLALRDGTIPVVIVDSRSGLQLEFAVMEDGPGFTVSGPGPERNLRRFNSGRSYDVKGMAEDLLAELGP